jgi:predicted AAA+ superfamily ATPase
MKRKEEAYLTEWYRNPYRKPLIIRGARQVGKSTLVRMFCQKNNLQLVEVNFEQNQTLHTLFASNDPIKIIQSLEILQNVKIDAENSILFLDEIQANPAAILSLRYFFEKVPALAVIAAGSLLEFALEQYKLSMPVGRIEYFFMGPMTFEEFLEAVGADQLLSYLQTYSLGDEIPQVIHEKALEHLRTYYLLGGMPEVIRVYRETRSLLEADKIKYSILNTYRDDFAKYQTRIDISKLQEVFDKLGSTVGKKIKYVELLPQDRSTVTDRILTLFEYARILYRTYHSSANNLPLKTEINQKYSKGILLDIGLYLTLQGLSIADIVQDKGLFFSCQGALAEQFIGQHLLYSQPTYMNPELYYWNREKAQSNAEVDFLIQQGNTILPIEVKSGKTGTLKSLHVFMETKQRSMALRFSTNTPIVETVKSSLPKSDYRYTLVTLPLYLVGQTRRLMKTALGK